MTTLQKIGNVLARIVAPILIVAIGVGGLLVFGQKPSQDEKPPETQRNTIVEVVDVLPFEGSFTVEVEGVALPLRQIRTSSQVAGLVKHKAPECRGGRYVEAGTVLIEIDPTDYELEQERLQAQLDQAAENLSEVSVEIENIQALIELSQEDHGLQKGQLQRITGLHERGASTDSALDDSRKQELDSRNALRMLENQLRTQQQKHETLQVARRLAAVGLKQSAENLARTKIAPPVSGTIISTAVEEGDYVKVGDRLFDVNDTDDMEVSCQLRVDELYWVWLQAGTFSADNGAQPAAAFEIPATPVDVVFNFKGVEYLWNGTLSRYDGTGLDASTRMVPCRVLVDEPTKVRVGGDGVRGLVAPPTLFSGMYVKVRIPITPPIPLVMVPASAIQPGGEVWLVRDGALDIEPVNVARTHDEFALLLPSSSGPQPGDRIVTSPLAGPTQGMEVEAIHPDSPLERAAAEAGPENQTADPPAEDASR